VLIQVAKGKARGVHPLMWAVCIGFLIFFLQAWILAVTVKATPVA
jgi:hypothetical protein